MKRQRRSCWLRRQLVGARVFRCTGFQCASRTRLIGLKLGCRLTRAKPPAHGQRFMVEGFSRTSLFARIRASSGRFPIVSRRSAAHRISSDNAAELIPLDAIERLETARLRQCPSAALQLKNIHIQAKDPAKRNGLWRCRFSHSNRQGDRQQQIFIGVMWNTSAR